MSLILETRNIDNFFGKGKASQVLTDICIGIKKGEFTSIMGKSGSGKSNLVYILAPMDTDYTGELYFENEFLTGKSQHKLSHIRNQKIGFIFQFHYLLTEFNLLENVILSAKKLGLKPDMVIKEEAMGLQAPGSSKSFKNFRWWKTKSCKHAHLSMNLCCFAN